MRALDHHQLVPGVRDRLARGGTSVRDAAELEVRSVAPLLEPAVRDALVRRVVAEVAGLGALDALLADPTIDEVMVNAGCDVWIERAGQLSRAGTLVPGALDVLIERILGPLGRRLDRVSPMVDARLPDGSRVCAVIPPAAVDGPSLSIRRFATRTLPVAAFTTPPVVELLHQLVAARCNIVVTGATSSGKTTLLNALATALPPNERIITLEDTAELRLCAPHVVRLESRSATADGLGALGLADLLRTALRMRPDRLVVGEVRGDEAVTLVQAMSTGHDGSLATCHANSALDGLRRLEVMVVQGAPGWPLDAVREQVHSSIDVVVHVARTGGPTRRIVEVSEVVEPSQLAGGSARTRPLARDGRVVGPLTRGRAVDAC